MMTFSLRFKFLFTILALLLLTVGTVLFMSTSYFKDDKKKSVFETQQILASGMASNLSSNFIGVQQIFANVAGEIAKSNLSEISSNTKISKMLFDESELLRFEMFFEVDQKINASPSFVYRNERFKDSEFQTLEVLPEYMAEVKAKGFSVANVTKGEVPLLQIASVLPITGKKSGAVYLVGLYQAEKFLKSFRLAPRYKPKLLDHRGRIILSSDFEHLIKRKTYSNNNVLQSLGSTKSDSGTFLGPIGSEGQGLFGFGKLKVGELTLLTELSEEQAYVAGQRLVEKTIFTAIAIFCLAMIIGVIFAKTITKSLQRLVEATYQIGQGNFDVMVPVHSSDEVGILSKSFKGMAVEIKRLLSVTAEKARMEKELETAQLVQNNFFPEPDIVNDDFELSAFYRPASECGGDWWGYFQAGDILHVCIGDATGHGVPAALITASVKSSFEVMSDLSEGKAEKMKPNDVLALLNKIVLNSGNQDVKMTFIVMSIHLKTGEIEFANAAHNFPMICQSSKSEQKLSRKDIQVLKNRPDMHLGDKLSKEYQLHKASILNGDTLFLYTDGILECTNPEKEMYGKRRLLKELFSNARESSGEIRDRLEKSAYDFFESFPQDDDITFVIIKFKSIGADLKRASA